MTKHLTVHEIRELSRKSRQTLFGDETTAQPNLTSISENSPVVPGNKSERPLVIREETQCKSTPEFGVFNKSTPIPSGPGRWGLELSSPASP